MQGVATVCAGYVLAMTRRDSIMLDLALAILRSEAGRKHQDPPRPEAVRLALHVMRAHVPPDSLVVFWRVSSTNDNANQRGLQLKRLLALIEAQCARATRARGRDSTQAP